jgi:hypothetical protein
MSKYWMIILFFSGKNISSRQTDIIIKWSDTTRLTYADFKGAQAPPKDSVARPDTLAVINAEIKYKLDISTGRQKIHAYGIMYPEHSWMKVRWPSLLKHEQGHFDIAEIYARKFEKRVNDTVFNDLPDFFTFIAASLKDVVAELNAEQDKYDKWTMNNLGRDYYYQWIHDQLYPSNKPDSAIKSSPF